MLTVKKSGGVTSQLKAVSIASQNVPSSGYIRFIRDALIPDGTQKVRAWVYTDESALFDSLDVRGSDCVNPVPEGVVTWSASCSDLNTDEGAGRRQLGIDYSKQHYYVNGQLVLKTFELQTPSRGDLNSPQRFSGSRTAVFNDYENASESFTTYGIPREGLVDGQLSRGSEYRLSSSQPTIDGTNRAGVRIDCTSVSRP